MKMITPVIKPKRKMEHTDALRRHVLSILQERGGWMTALEIGQALQMKVHNSTDHSRVLKLLRKRGCVRIREGHTRAGREYRFAMRYF